MNIEMKNQIYRRAKELYKTEPECEGMCQAIHEAFLEIASGISIFKTTAFVSLFPELFKLCPEGISIGKNWWPKKDREIRLEKFDILIKETNGENKIIDKRAKA